jgi:multiple sugar transport system substrate-binding protein
MQLVAAQAVAGTLSIDEAATEMDRRADRILEKRRWILDHERHAAGAAP